MKISAEMLVEAIAEKYKIRQPEARKYLNRVSKTIRELIETKDVTAFTLPFLFTIDFKEFQVSRTHNYVTKSWDTNVYRMKPTIQMSQALRCKIKKALENVRKEQG